MRCGLCPRIARRCYWRPRIGTGPALESGWRPGLGCRRWSGPRFAFVPLVSGTGVAIGVAVGGAAVGVAVGVGGGICVGVAVGVAVGTRVGRGVQVGVGVSSGTITGVWVGSGVAVGGSGVAVAVGVGVTVGGGGSMISWADAVAATRAAPKRTLRITTALIIVIPQIFSCPAYVYRNPGLWRRSRCRWRRLVAQRRASRHRRIGLGRCQGKIP